MLIILIDILPQPWDALGFKLLMIWVISSSFMMIFCISLSVLDLKSGSALEFLIGEHREIKNL